MALVKFKAAQTLRKPIQGVSNMIQDLVGGDWNPDFAEAHNMLGDRSLRAARRGPPQPNSIKVGIPIQPATDSTF